MVKDLFDMADRYASQEEAMSTEHDDRPRQNQKKDAAESSKQKDRKRKGDDLVAAIECSRLPRDPCTDDFDKVLINGGSGLNILFAKTLNNMKISRSELKRSNSPFYGVIPGPRQYPSG